MENAPKFKAENPVILLDLSENSPLLQLRLSDTDATMAFYLEESALADLRAEIDNYFQGCALNPELRNAPRNVQ